MWVSVKGCACVCVCRKRGAKVAPRSRDGGKPCAPAPFRKRSPFDLLAHPPCRPKAAVGACLCLLCLCPTPYHTNQPHTGGVLGDALAQTTTGLPFDAARNLRLASFGLVFGGPAGHVWHRFLDARCFPAAPHSATAVASKLVLDQLLFAPVATALLFAFLKIAEGTPDQAMAFVAANWWRTLKANWVLWPLANTAAFALIPADLRILYGNAVGVLWCCYVSLSCSGPGAPPPPPPLDKLE